MTDKSTKATEQADTVPTGEIVAAPEMPFCRTCGSDNVVRDAWASWNADTQQWELEDVFDYAFCKACEETARIEWKATEPSRSDRIRALNDALRTGTSDDGMIVITSGVRSFGSDFVAEARNAVAVFSGFNDDNDPHGEHDFGSLDVGGAS